MIVAAAAADDDDDADAAADPPAADAARIADAVDDLAGLVAEAAVVELWRTA